MKYRYSGHGTFPCRYTWLPKAVRHLCDNPGLFGDEDAAMVRLGVGKNMVRAIRLWAEAADVAIPTSNRGPDMAVSSFGRMILAPGGLDEFFEDIQTLWLVHWKLSTQVREPLFAWHYLLNHWHRPDFTRAEVLAAFRAETQREEKPLSPVTLEEHFNVFLRTYIPTQSAKRELVEESLDCPLVELELLQEVGERAGAEGTRRERIYAFRIEEKPEVSPELFVYCLDDFWRKWNSQERTLSFNQVATAACSPGQVFKLPEQAIRDRLSTIQRESGGAFTYQESSIMPQVARNGDPSPDALLRKVYHRK